MAATRTPARRAARKGTKSPATTSAAHWPLPLPPTTSRPQLLDSNGESDLRFRQFLYDFSTLGAHIDTVRGYLASLANLSSPQYNCAMTIAYHQGASGVSVSDVAKLLHVSTAFITTEVGKLERAGLVAKHDNPNDGRGILLRLTKQGERAMREIGAQRREVNDRLFRSLSARDFANLARIVASLLDDFAATVQLIRAMDASEANLLPHGFLFENLRSGALRQ